MSGALTPEAQETREETYNELLRSGVIRNLQYECWKTAEDHGWHDQDKVPSYDDIDVMLDVDPLMVRDWLVRLLQKPPRTFGDLIALITSEASEALEAHREGHAPTETWYGGTDGTKPEGVPSELADIIIRTLDMAQIYGIDLAAALQEKMAYNESREYRHGGKVI